MSEDYHRLTTFISDRVVDLKNPEFYDFVLYPKVMHATGSAVWGTAWSGRWEEHRRQREALGEEKWNALFRRYNISYDRKKCKFRFFGPVVRRINAGAKEELRQRYGDKDVEFRESQNYNPKDYLEAFFWQTDCYTSMNANVQVVF